MKLYIGPSQGHEFYTNCLCTLSTDNEQKNHDKPCLEHEHCNIKVPIETFVKFSENYRNKFIVPWIYRI